MVLGDGGAPLEILQRVGADRIASRRAA